MARAEGHRNPERFVEAHVRRLEALRRAGIVERLNEGVWRVPKDLPERGRAFASRRISEAAAELRSHVSIQQQQRVLGATWLDQQIIAGCKDIARAGFGDEVWSSLKERADFLIEQGLATRQDGRFKPVRDLLSILRKRDVDRAGETLAKETGLAYRPTQDGQRIAGTYRKSVQLASGRFAMIDDGRGFSLVPWRQVLEKELGRSIGGIVQGNDMSWQLGRDRGISR